MNSNGDSDYEVGYGKPPKATQFVKGQSGNPKGRPRKARAEDLTDIEREMNAPGGTLNIRGRERVISIQERLYRQWILAAAQGDVRAAALLHSEEMALKRKKVLRLCGSPNPQPPKPRGYFYFPLVDPDVLEVLAVAHQARLIAETKVD